MNSTDAIILKKTDFGEADMLLTIYTKDFGKIRALAQGVKKEGAKLKGHLESLNLSALAFVWGRNGERVTYANLLNHWTNIRGDWRKICAAYAMLKMLDENIMPGLRDDKIWELILQSLGRLEYGVMPESFLEDFREKLFSILQPQ